MHRQSLQAAPLLALLTVAALQASMAAETRYRHNSLRERGTLTQAPEQVRARGTITASGAPVAAAEDVDTGGISPSDVERERLLVEALRRDWRQADADGDGHLNHGEVAAFRERLRQPGDAADGPGVAAQASTRLRR